MNESNVIILYRYDVVSFTFSFLIIIIIYLPLHHHLASCYIVNICSILDNNGGITYIILIER